MKINIFLLLMSVLMISCDQEADKKVTTPEDYNEYLAVKESRTTSPYFELWNSKITKDSLELPSFAAVAGQYLSLIHI